MGNSRKYLYHTMRGILEFQRRRGSLYRNSEVKQGEREAGIRLRILEAWGGGGAGVGLLLLDFQRGKNLSRYSLLYNKTDFYGHEKL